jgi:hypothetical protein
MVLGTYVVVHKGAGIPPPLIPFSRLPAALVASLEVLAAGVFFLQVRRFGE